MKPDMTSQFTSLRALLASAVFALHAIPLAQAELPEPVKQSLKTLGLPSDALSVAIVPLDGAGAAQFHLADQPRNPASTMKLVTTWAGLNLLGPAW